MRMLALLVAATLAGGAVAAPPASLVERLFKAEKLFKPAMKAAEKERPPFPSRWGEAATEHQPPTSFSFPERRLSPYPREPILSTEKGGEMWVLPVKPVLEPTPNLHAEPVAKKREDAEAFKALRDLAVEKNDADSMLKMSDLILSGKVSEREEPYHSYWLVRAIRANEKTALKESFKHALKEKLKAECIRSATKRATDQWFDRACNTLDHKTYYVDRGRQGNDSFELESIKSVSPRIALSGTQARAGEKSVSSCLRSIDPKTCLVFAAKSRLDSMSSDSDAAESYATLMATQVKANARNDGVYERSKTVDERPGSLLGKWQMMVARRGYALKYLLSDDTVSDLERIASLAMTVRARAESMERLQLMIFACEAKDGLSKDELMKWQGILDDQCRLDETEVRKLEETLPGLSILAAPMIHAYRQDSESLSESLGASLEVLANYKSLLDNKRLTSGERDAIHILIFLGNFMNSTALVLSGRTLEAQDAIRHVLVHLRSAPSIIADPSLGLVRGQLAWLMAKADLKKEAMAQVRDTLRQVDQQMTMTLVDQVSAISSCIEALAVLKRKS